MTDSMKGLIPKIKADIEELFNTLENLEVDRVDALEDRIAALEANSPALTVVQGQGQQRDNVAQATPKVLPTSPALLQGDVHVDNEILGLQGRDELLCLLKDAYSYIDRRSQALDVNHEDYNWTLNLEIRLRDFLQNGPKEQDQKRTVDLDNVIAIIECEADRWKREGCYAHQNALLELVGTLNRTYEARSGSGPKRDL